jgi:hypothetical protein
LTKVKFYDILGIPCERERLVDPLSVGKRTRRKARQCPIAGPFAFQDTLHQIVSVEQLIEA